MEDRDPIRREHLAAGAIYGIVAYLAILVLLEEDHTDPMDAIAILVGSAFVYWLAHVYAHLLPRMAAVGRLRSGRFWETAADQIGVLLVVLVPVVPLFLGVVGILSAPTAVRLGDRGRHRVARGVRDPGSPRGGARLASVPADGRRPGARGRRAPLVRGSAALTGRQPVQPSKDRYAMPPFRAKDWNTPSIGSPKRTRRGVRGSPTANHSSSSVVSSSSSPSSGHIA